MARCSFDIHVQEILGAFYEWSYTMMLHPGGTIDFDYLIQHVLRKKQITYIHTVPSLSSQFFHFYQTV